MRHHFVRSVSSQWTNCKFLLLLMVLSLGMLAPAQITKVPQPTRPVKVLRHFDAAANMHAFTTDDDGAAKLAGSFQRESTVEGTPGSPFFYLATMQFPGTAPLYRFAAADGSQRFVRTPMERAALRGKGLREIAQPVFVYTKPVEGASEIFCLTNPENGDVVYTTSKEEHIYLLGQGWSEQGSLGYTQSTSSSGTGNLWPTTVKLEDGDMALIASPAGDGSKLVFASTNEKIAKLAPGTMIYAPVEINRNTNGDLLFRKGLMRQVTSVARKGAGLVVETTEAQYKDLFHDIHLFMDNRPAAFPKHHAGAPAASFAPTLEPARSTRKSFDGLKEYHEPEYLGKVARPINEDESASLEFNEDLNYPLGDDGVNLVTVSGSLGAELTGEINVSAGCSDSINLYFTSICDQFTVGGTVLFTPSAMASATADVNVGGNFSIEQKVFEESETFEVEGIPVTVTFDIKVGASIADQATMTFSASALARATGGFSASLVVPEVWDSSGSLIGCPNPCPSGFSCGASDQGYSGTGPTCSITASASDNINLNPGTIDAKVWVTPEISAGPGIDDLSASVSFALQNALEFDISSSNVTGTYELTPSIGYEVGACIWGENIGYSNSTDIATLDVPIFSGGMPAATTMPPSQISLGAAVASGVVTPTDLVTTVYFLYSTSPTLAGAMQSTSKTCAGTQCTINIPLPNLMQATTYYSEMVATNLIGTTMGGIMSFHVPTTQTITFPNPGNQTYGIAPFALTATSTSGLPITYTTIGPAVVNGNTLFITGTGQVTVLADQAGNVDYVPATEVSVSFMVMPEAGNFGTVAVGQTSPVLSVGFTLAPGTNVGTVSVLTEGATGQDFQGTPMGMTGDVFNVNVTFSPLAPGPRNGAVVVYDTSTPANLLAMAYLSGTGTGPQIIFETNQAISTLGSGFVAPTAVAVDGSGNVYVAEDQPTGGISGSYYGEVQEILAAGGYTTVNTLVGNSGPLYTPTGITVDGAGNIWIADSANRVIWQFIDPGYSTWNAVRGSFTRPHGVAVDGDGNVYVADTSNNVVKEVLASSNFLTVNTLGSGFSSPGGVAVDANGNVYVSDTGNNAVKEILAAGGYTTVNTLGSGFSSPNGIAVDAAGNVYVADTGNNAIKEILAASGYTTVQNLGSGFSAPNGVALDASGNVYVADTGNNAVKKLDFSNPPSLTFAATSINAVSSNSPLMLTVANDGNAPLEFPYNPILPAGFPLANASNCPEVGSSGAPAVLAPGASCSFALSFTPTEPGEISATLVLTDNNMNAAAPNYANQSIQLSGSGLFSALLTASVTAESKTYDGTAAATTGGCTLSGILPSDQGLVTCSITSASFASAGVGNGITVSVPVSITGPAAGHYTLSNPTVTTAASITPATLTVAANNLSMPVGGTVPAVTFAYSGFVNGESSSVVTTAPTCSTTATSSSIQGVYPITCSGGTAADYNFQYENGKLTVSLMAQFVATGYSLGSGFSSAGGVAVDTAGNIYVADTGNNAIKKILVGTGYSTTTLVTGLSSPGGVAVDSSGNLYVADTGNNAVKQILAAGGYVTVKILGSGFKSPAAVAVDSKGNVFVADTGNNAVKEIAAAGGYTTVTTLGSGFLTPTGVAVDSKEDVFVADKGNSAVKEILPAGGYHTVNTLSSGFSSPYGVALDTNWNVYVTDTGNGVVKQLNAPAYTTGMTLGGGLTTAKGLALDATGNVYVAPGGTAAVQVIAYAPCFPVTALASSSLKYSYSFTFLMGGSISAPAVLTQGATGQDFADAGTGSCTTNGASHVYSAGDSCTVDVIFTPKHPGLRLGSVQLTSSTGSLVATALVSGTGSAPQVVFPGNNTPTALGSGLKTPSAVAVDASGNVFVADTANNAVKEILAAGGYTTVKVLGSGFSSPSSVAVDGGGNVYVADSGNNALKEIVAVGGYVTVQTLGGAFVHPTGVAVDGTGNVFVVDGGDNVAYEILWGGLVVNLGSAFSSPNGVAVDANGNIFVADTGDNAVKEFLAAGGYTTLNTVGSGFSSPSGVAVDASGNVYVADTGNKAVKEILVSGGYVTVNTLASGINGPTGVVVDASGNVFVSVGAGNSVIELPFSKPPALSFASTAIGATSAAQTITLQNNGNAALLPVFVGAGTVPTISTGFAITGGTCTSMIVKGSPWLAQGASCTVTVAFTPKSGQSGTVSGTLSYTDNALNLNPATQSIALSGSVQQVPAVLTSPTPGSTLSGASVTFTWTAASAGNQGYWLFLGTTGVGSKNLYDSGQQTATSATFSNLPTNGVKIYARVYTEFNGVLVYNDYTYTANNGAMQAPALTSPTPGSTLAGQSVTFTWTAAGAGNQGYWLFLGTTGAGSKNLYDSGQQTATSATVSGLPSNGVPIYARVYTRYNGVLVYNDYTYTSWMQPPVLTSPTPGSTLAGSSVTFTWTAGSTGEQGYWLFLGTTGVGSKDLYDSGQQTGTSATVSGLPTNGATIYARVYTRYNGVLVFNDYTYKAQ